MIDIPAGYEACAWLNYTKHNAWLIYTPDPTRDVTDDAEYDAAASLPMAKRVARENAAQWGYGPGFRWEQTAKYLWTLYGQPPPERGED